MLLLLLNGFIHSVASSKLLSINPYDKNKNTKYYLDSGCRLLTENHFMRYESEEIRENQQFEYYKNCMLAIWPGSSTKHIHELHQPFVEYFESFEKGRTLAHRETGKFVAFEDGFRLPSTCHDNFLYYHKDKPPMNLTLLQKLPWPQDKELLSYRNLELKKIAASDRSSRSDHPDVTIVYAKGLKHISFANFIKWIKGFFNMEKYDSAQLGKFRRILTSSFPGIKLLKIHRLGSKTRVVPAHGRFHLIPPNEMIAARYDPEILELVKLIEIPKYSTIVTDFEHEGTTYCLVLKFDILEDDDDGN